LALRGRRSQLKRLIILSAAKDLSRFSLRNEKIYIFLGLGRQTRFIA
jgi:hypothetical protein